jgi:RNA polymerase-binding transcription factor DksA
MQLTTLQKLNESDVNILKQSLVELKAQLTERLEKIKKDIYAREEPLERVRQRLQQREPLDPDFEEQAVEQENYEVLQQLYRDGEQELTSVESALTRIEKGSYGYCAKCAELISIERLYALPYTQYCRNCAV